MKKILLLVLLCPIFLFGQIQIGSTIIGKSSEDGFGVRVSLSADGTILAASATGNDDNGDNSGHVRVFKNESGVWTQIGADINGKAAGDALGSVQLSSDGSIIAIGSNSSNNGKGYVRVFKNDSGVWTQIGSDISGEAIGDQFGVSVALSSDGSIVAIGAPGNDNAGGNYGNVRIFKNESGSWTQVGSSINGTDSNGYFGYAIDLNSDGSIIAIGAQWMDDNGTWSGQVKVFKNDSGVWTQIGSNLNGDMTRDQFGNSVSLSSDGSILAVGAIANDFSNPREGYVRVFKNDSGVWSQIGSNITGDSDFDMFGGSVSLSSDGNILAIGGTEYNQNNTTNGYFKIYRNNSNSWLQIGQRVNGDSGGDRFGFSVSLSSSGNQVAVGGVPYLEFSSGRGYVKVFDLSSVLSLNKSKLENSFNLYPNPAQNQITLDVKNSILKKVNIYNNLGQLVMQSKEKEINTTKLNAGVYFVKVATDKGKSIRKLIVE